MFATRFAPSPTGLLHLGHAFSAWTAFALARAEGGRFLLRIEDLDHTRCRPEFEAAIVEDLDWLGLAWDAPPRRQSDHMEEYRAVLEDLRARGLLYRCFRSRKDLDALAAAPHNGIDPARPGPLPLPEEEKLLEQDRPFAWRLSMAACLAVLDGRDLRFEADGETCRADLASLGDEVLARKDFPASYHLASVWDDARDRITHVVRGEDLRPAADLHVLLQMLLGLPTPVYRHHALIRDANGRRLAKRDRDQTLRALREAGRLPRDILNGLGLLETAPR